MNPNFRKLPEGKLTFAQLETLVSHWSIDTDECAKVFQLQTAETKKLFLKCCQYNEKLAPMYVKLGKLRCLQDHIDANLQYIFNLLFDVESKIREFEKCPCPCRDAPLDPIRSGVYKAVEEINATLVNIEKSIFLFELNYCVKDVNLQSSFEDAVCILCCELDQLEMIDARIRELQDKLTWCDACQSRICANKKHPH
ncbi:unnamed protein product [Phyllotreta striolata]|uniref:Uncharacterized protein n=1 Tax=Phyllotreta striolata TaxID=444603 RepID=A0A9N9TT95_PHYSR|nr:unnamed protein product [Phyllotreta striolata]